MSKEQDSLTSSTSAVKLKKPTGFQKFIAEASGSSTSQSKAIKTPPTERKDKNWFLAGNWERTSWQADSPTPDRKTSSEKRTEKEKTVHLPTGESVSGDWNDDKIEGRVTILYPNEDKFEGFISNGKRIAGKMTLKTGQVQYESAWSNDCPLAHGKLSFKNGIYLGDVLISPVGKFQFKTFAVTRHGYGKMGSTAGKSKYLGYWRNDKCHGFGVHVSNSGEKYWGGWKDGVKSGFGVELQPDGSYYEGSFQNGFRKGKGKLAMPNGDSIVGEWHQDRLLNGSYTKGSIEDIPKSLFGIFRARLDAPLTTDQKVEISSPGKWTQLIDTVLEDFVIKPKEISNLELILKEHTKQPAKTRLETTFLPALQLISIHEQFAYNFNWDYESATSLRHASNVFNLRSAVDDIQSFLFSIADYIFARTENADPTHKKRISQMCSESVFPMVHDTLMDLYNLVNHTNNDLLYAKILELGPCSPREVGVNPKFIPACFHHPTIKQLTTSDQKSGSGGAFKTVKTPSKEKSSHALLRSKANHKLNFDPSKVAHLEEPTDHDRHHTRRDSDDAGPSGDQSPRGHGSLSRRPSTRGSLSSDDPTAQSIVPKLRTGRSSRNLAQEGKEITPRETSPNGKKLTKKTTQRSLTDPDESAKLNEKEGLKSGRSHSGPGRSSVNKHGRSVGTSPSPGPESRKSTDLAHRVESRGRSGGTSPVDGKSADSSPLRLSTENAQKSTDSDKKSGESPKSTNPNSPKATDLSSNNNQQPPSPPETRKVGVVPALQPVVVVAGPSEEEGGSGGIPSNPAKRSSVSGPTSDSLASTPRSSSSIRNTTIANLLQKQREKSESTANTSLGGSGSVSKNERTSPEGGSPKVTSIEEGQVGTSDEKIGSFGSDGSSESHTLENQLPLSGSGTSIVQLPEIPKESPKEFGLSVMIPDPRMSGRKRDGVDKPLPSPKRPGRDRGFRTAGEFPMPISKDPPPSPSTVPPLLYAQAHEALRLINDMDPSDPKFLDLSVIEDTSGNEFSFLDPTYVDPETGGLGRGAIAWTNQTPAPEQNGKNDVKASDGKRPFHKYWKLDKDNKAALGM